MRAKQIALQSRMAFFLCCYVVGFLVPWDRSGRTSTLWLAAATISARTGWINLGFATITVTILALVLLVAGSSLRVWGRLSPDHAIRPQALGSAVDCAELQNPIYLGSWLIGLATSILMPPGGAAFFLIVSGVYLYTLRRFCQSGSTIPAGTRDELLREGTVTDTPARLAPGWVKALVTEFYPLSFTLCFATLAWRYNAHILVRCLILCFGGSLVVRGFLGKQNGPDRDAFARKHENG